LGFYKYYRCSAPIWFFNYWDSINISGALHLVLLRTWFFYINDGASAPVILKIAILCGVGGLGGRDGEGGSFPILDVTPVY